MSRFHALIPAAGSGSRMGGALPKQYLELKGLPLIAHALAALAREPRIDRLVVVLSPDDAWWDSYDWSGWQDRMQVLRCGGAARAGTVLNGLQAMAEWCAADDWVLVHDAARCLVQPASIERLIDACTADPVGGLLALPLADTLKQADAADRVAATLDRRGKWLAQTPQMFRLGVLQRALAQADGNVTDEASAVEALGHAPLLVRGEPDNFKLTWPADFALAARLLACP